MSIGVLASVFSAALVDEVIEEAGAREVRYRSLPARLMVFYELALAVTGQAGLSPSDLARALTQALPVAARPA